MFFSFASTIIIITLIFIEPQYDTFLYGESCYFDFENTSEYSPYVKTKFCIRYFLWNDAIYCVIIVALSALIIRMIYSETKAEDNDKTNKFKIENDTLQVKLNKLEKSNKLLLTEIEDLQTVNDEVIAFKNNLDQLNELHNDLVAVLKNELNSELFKTTELEKEKDKLIDLYNELVVKFNNELKNVRFKNKELVKEINSELQDIYIKNDALNDISNGQLDTYHDIIDFALNIPKNLDLNN